ncbi:hypothetical protein KRP22_013533 [Phytophthora ramorum]|nr:hypothetical protein KRP22_11296 [Phytophthora ramorum]
MADKTYFEQRWGFLAAWCRPLAQKLLYVGFQCEGSGRDDDRQWVTSNPRLQVTLPSRRAFQQDEALYLQELIKIRESLALLAAVARVDHAAWKFLLDAHCHVNWWREGEENFPELLPATFVVKFDNARADIVKFCNLEKSSDGFLEAMKMVAERGGGMGQGLDIPIRVAHDRGTMEFTAEDFEKKLLKGLSGVARAEKVVRERSQRDNGRVDKETITCRFVLEPMVADIQDVKSVKKTAEIMERLLINDVWFSLVSVQVASEAARNDPESIIGFRQLMIAAFDATRRDFKQSNTRYLSNTGRSSPLQLGSLVLHPQMPLGEKEMEALFSALVLNQTTQKLSMWMYSGYYNDDTKIQSWWKWLAYGCFSKRARACSALQSLELSQIGSLSVKEVEAFLAILDSDRPEELLYDCPRGLVDISDATLKAGAQVQYDIQDGGEPHSVTFTSCRFVLRTFSDDGRSEWVNVLVPGFGRCLVRRSELVFQPVQELKLNRPSLTALTLRLNEGASTDGLPRLLAAIGSSLELLTIENPGNVVDVSVIIRCCPNLEVLSLKSGLVEDLQLHVGTRNSPISTLRLDWNNVEALARSLSDMNNPLVKCVRQLKVRLVIANEADERGYQPEEVIRSLDALLQMLAVNKSLQYLDVRVSNEYQRYLSSFRGYHHELINAGLNVESKIAFLSVLDQESAVDANAKKTCTASRIRRRLWRFDQNVLSSIFAFAARRVPRRVCFHG